MGYRVYEVDRLLKPRWTGSRSRPSMISEYVSSTCTVLLPIVTEGLHTGLRKGELLGLTWERLGFSRGLIARGRRTKSGKGTDVRRPGAATVRRRR